MRHTSLSKDVIPLLALPFKVTPRHISSSFHHGLTYPRRTSALVAVIFTFLAARCTFSSLRGGYEEKSPQNMTINAVITIWNGKIRVFFILSIIQDPGYSLESDPRLILVADWLIGALRNEPL